MGARPLAYLVLKNASGMLSFRPRNSFATPSDMFSCIFQRMNFL